MNSPSTPSTPKPSQGDKPPTSPGGGGSEPEPQEEEQLPAEPDPDPGR